MRPQPTSSGFYWHQTVYVWQNLCRAPDKRDAGAGLFFRGGEVGACVRVLTRDECVFCMAEHCCPRSPLARRKEAVEVGSREKEREVALQHSECEEGTGD